MHYRKSLNDLSISSDDIKKALKKSMNIDDIKYTEIHDELVS